MPYTDLRAQVQRFELTLLPLCARWDIHPARLKDNVHYYTYILCYVDDILCMHHDPMSVMGEINKYLPLKPSSLGDPDIYLGAKLKEMRLPNGVMAWGLSPFKYDI
jgi:hypothetical protein